MSQAKLDYFNDAELTSLADEIVKDNITLSTPPINPSFVLVRVDSNDLEEFEIKSNYPSRYPSATPRHSYTYTNTVQPTMECIERSHSNNNSLSISFQPKLTTPQPSSSSFLPKLSLLADDSATSTLPSLPSVDNDRSWKLSKIKSQTPTYHNHTHLTNPYQHSAQHSQHCAIHPRPKHTHLNVSKMSNSNSRSISHSKYSRTRSMSTASISRHKVPKKAVCAIPDFTSPTTHCTDDDDSEVSDCARAVLTPSPRTRRSHTQTTAGQHRKQHIPNATTARNAYPGPEKGWKSPSQRPRHSASSKARYSVFL